MNSSWPLDSRMTVVLFAGMGGGCDGLEAAGFPVHVAINHDPVAVAVHEMRHRHTKHMRCDVFEACPREVAGGRGVRILHASPDCTHFSIARGGKPVSKRVRSLAWVVCRWAGTVRPETITLENVREIQTWGPLIARRDKVTGRVVKLDGSVAVKGERVPVGMQQLVPDPKRKGHTWRAWMKHMRGLGYSFEGRVLVCADYGVPTIRKRFFGVAKADGSKIVWPARTHAPRKEAKRLGLKPWVGAHTIIDWSLPVKSIFGRKRPLAEATLRRIARGLMRYVVNAAKPFIVDTAHGEGQGRGVSEWSVDEPLRTVGASPGKGVVAVHLSAAQHGGSVFSVENPSHTWTASRKDQNQVITAKLIGVTMIQSGFGERHGQAPRVLDIKEPAGTQVAGGSKAALVATFLAQHNGGQRAPFGARNTCDPLSAVTTTGSQQCVVQASMFNVKSTDSCGQDIVDPTSTIAACGNQNAKRILSFLQHYYSSGGQDGGMDDPLGAVTAKARHGLVTVNVGSTSYAILDVGMRMLEPEEGASAHGFAPGSLPTEIMVDGVTRRLTKAEKYHLVGNSVPPLMVQLLSECNVRRELMEAAE